jgi:hypothetical protein
MDEGTMRALLGELGMNLDGEEKVADLELWTTLAFEIASFTPSSSSSTNTKSKSEGSKKKKQQQQQRSSRSSKPPHRNKVADLLQGDVEMEMLQAKKSFHTLLRNKESKADDGEKDSQQSPAMLLSNLKTKRVLHLLEKRRKQARKEEQEREGQTGRLQKPPSPRVRSSSTQGSPDLSTADDTDGSPLMVPPPGMSGYSLYSGSLSPLLKGSVFREDEQKGGLEESLSLHPYSLDASSHDQQQQQQQTTTQSSSSQSPRRWKRYSYDEASVQDRSSNEEEVEDSDSVLRGKSSSMHEPSMLTWLGDQSWKDQEVKDGYTEVTDDRRLYGGLGGDFQSLLDGGSSSSFSMDSSDDESDTSSVSFLPFYSSSSSSSSLSATNSTMFSHPSYLDFDRQGSLESQSSSQDQEDEEEDDDEEEDEEESERDEQASSFNFYPQTTFEPTSSLDDSVFFGNLTNLDSSSIASLFPSQQK